MSKLSTRLITCMRRANMRVSDLARWLDRPRTTVETWLQGREPARYYWESVDRQLSLLETAISRGFSVPIGLPWRDRIRIIVEKRDGAKRNDRVSKGRAA